MESSVAVLAASGHSHIIYGDDHGEHWHIGGDECRTWSAGKVLHEDRSAYSDMCVAPDLTICCLFDRGEGTSYEGLALARFDLAWLTNGGDTLA